ncbi:MAG: tryptophan-rich sensory protein [Candidatus Parcubacteria bacterium]|nr:tryptophan-rich sensory protein [Candidatus Parcubacteria bacterium]
MKTNYIIIPLITILVALAGSLLTGWGMGWYHNLNLMSWTPSGMLIGMVWTILFILSTICVLIIYNKKYCGRESIFWLVMVLFAANAALNIMWSFLFFALHLLSLAIIEAFILGLSVVALIILIWPRAKLAAILLIPYAGWVFFATYLTYSIWLLNK